MSETFPDLMESPPPPPFEPSGCEPIVPILPPPVPGSNTVRGRDLLVAVPILWAAEVLTGLLLLCWIGLRGEPEEHPAAVLITALLSGATTLLVSWRFVCRKYGKSFASGFHFTRPTRRALLTALACGGGCGLLACAVSCLFSDGDSFMRRLVETPLGLTSVAILSVALVPVEEIYYRGFIFPVLQRKLGTAVAVAAVSIWFGLAHVPQLLGDPSAIPVVLAAGIMWTVQRARSGGLTLGTLTHLFYNLTLIVLTLAWAAGGSGG